MISTTSFRIMVLSVPTFSGKIEWSSSMPDLYWIIFQCKSLCCSLFEGLLWKTEPCKKMLDWFWVPFLFLGKNNFLLGKESFKYCQGSRCLWVLSHVCVVCSFGSWCLPGVQPAGWWLDQRFYSRQGLLSSVYLSNVLTPGCGWVCCPGC